MYILKIKSTDNADYIQIRDDEYTLIAYFCQNNIERSLKNLDIPVKMEELKNIIQKIPYNKILKLD